MINDPSSGGDGGAPAASACDPSVSAESKAVANAALDELFVDKDTSAIDRYWADPYLQHNPIAESGVDAFRSVMTSFVTSPSFSYQRLHTVAECDLVVVLGNYGNGGQFRQLDEAELEALWDATGGHRTAAVRRMQALRNKAATLSQDEIRHVRLEQWLERFEDVSPPPDQL